MGAWWLVSLCCGFCLVLQVQFGLVWVCFGCCLLCLGLRFVFIGSFSFNLLLYGVWVWFILVCLFNVLLVELVCW